MSDLCKILPIITRRMADEAFRKSEQAHRLDTHIAPIKQFVAELQDPTNSLWLPEVAPMHGGIDAMVLSILRDPGPKTQDGSGSGFLCIENDDPTAERQLQLQLQLFEQHGISPRKVLRKAPLSQRDWDDAHLINAARDIHADDPAFGCRFIADELPGRGITAGENRVVRLCSQERIWSIFAKKRGLNRRSGPPVHDDLVQRQFSAHVPNQVWLADIT